MNQKKPEPTKSPSANERVVSQRATAAAEEAFKHGGSPRAALLAAKGATTSLEARRLTYTPHTGARQRERAKKFAKVTEHT